MNDFNVRHQPRNNNNNNNNNNSLDLKIATESLLRTDFGSELQTAGAEHRKARFANAVVVKGCHGIVVVDHRLWPCSQFWIRRQRYDRTEVLKTLNVSRDTL